ncbi:MAG: Gfo/Idh/MocA family oxidoreductase [Phycisphaerales bacterium]|nr:MAG: Gfo/Idh/MocA family oxidoreductase [Phycisphaerales bacterium]
MSEPIPVAVIGVGHMGRHHARIYHELPETRLVAVVDRDAGRAGEIAHKHECEALTEPDKILDKVRAVSVSVPTVHHLEAARPFLERGVAALIEKPIAGTPDEAEELLALARRHHALIQVGHTERFNPVVTAIGRMGITPKFIETHRISPFTFRSADIGVVMDMMIHDIDIVLHLVRDRNPRVDAVGVNVLGPHEDIANARLRFGNGCVANLTASRLALKTERKIRVFSHEAYLSLDYQKKSGIAIKKDANLDVLKLARERNADDLAQLAGTDFGKMVKVEPLIIEDAEPLKAELEAFIHCVRTGDTPPVTAEDGAAAVRLAHEITDSIKSHSWHG